MNPLKRPLSSAPLVMSSKSKIRNPQFPMYGRFSLKRPTKLLMTPPWVKTTETPSEVLFRLSKILLWKPRLDSAPKGFNAPFDNRLYNRPNPLLFLSLGLNSIFSKIPMLRSWILWSIVNLMPFGFVFLGEGCPIV